MKPYYQDDAVQIWYSTPSEALAAVQDGKLDGSVNLSNRGLTALPNLTGVRVTGNFYCDGNRLTSLHGAPAHVGGSFYCDGNRLTSLQGAPATVGGTFNCSGNRLTSLRGAPATVGGNFSCGYNRLTSLQGASAHVGGDFYCSGNRLTSLRWAPATVGGYFYCYENPGRFTEADIKAAQQASAICLSLLKIGRAHV